MAVRKAPGASGRMRRARSSTTNRRQARSRSASIACCVPEVERLAEKLDIMKIEKPNRVRVAWVMAAALQMGAQGATIVQTSTRTLPLTASPSGTVSYTTIGYINQYAGFGVLTPPAGTKRDPSPQIPFQGPSIGVDPSQPFNRVVQSDFNLVLPGIEGQIAALDPSTSDAGPMPSVAGTTSVKSASLRHAPSFPTATRIASDLGYEVGGGVLPVMATGALPTTSPLDPFKNTSGIGDAGRHGFADRSKVFTVLGVQPFGLVATRLVTQTVPEASGYGAVAGLAGLVGWHCWVRRQRS